MKSLTNFFLIRIAQVLRSYPESEEKPCADPMLRVGNRQGWGKAHGRRIPLLRAI